MKITLFLLGLFLLQGSFAEAKKTVCSITINSDDEINAFKSELSADEFNFVELTKNNLGSADWFQNSCESKVQCDILVVSGHFAGTFFGKSGISLGISDLENASCRSECDGILKRPKEVFLFGCNTLAGKEADQRSPEQYLQVLMNDGFTTAQAQQVVAYRYSPVGGRFSYRMSQIFNKTPRIYGFTSVSPLGKYNAPLLSSYLKQNASFYANLDQVTSQKNTSFLKSFSKTAIVQETGAAINDHQLSPVCYLSNENKVTARIDKLRWIADSLERSESLELLVHFTEFFKEQNFNKKFNSEELSIFTKIKENSALKEQLIALVGSNKMWLRRTQAEVLEFMRVIDWVDAKAYTEKIIQITNLNKSDFTYDDMQFACGMKIQVGLRVRDFSERQWRNQSFRYAVSCLDSKSSEIWEKVNSYN